MIWLLISLYWNVDTNQYVAKVSPTKYQTEKSCMKDLKHLMGNKADGFMCAAIENTNR